MAPNKQTSFFLFITPPLKAAKDAKLQLQALLNTKISLMVETLISSISL